MMAEQLNDEDNKFNENVEKEEADSESMANPAPPPDFDLDLLRGDRIGDTVYSAKWCIQTVMKLLQSNVVSKSADGEDRNELVDMEDDLQDEVGVLWDMTINLDVCLYLHSVGAIESIYHVIANSRCPRATEMCVGMLGNIVSHDELWQSLHSDETLFANLIPLFGHSDQPLLSELSRFFNTALNHKENRCCYDSMWDNRQIISQELVRILSGSTNSDLLRQTSELTYILMNLDVDDSRFNMLFADVDFITAVLEASKEFGSKQESSGQVKVLDILHCFTTFQAGIAAIEPCMEEITRTAVNYLKLLCHSLNLSSSCDVITVILRILNHVFCRSLAVRHELMSSPKLVHCILKTLVSVYRRLGLYSSIAFPPTHKNTKREMKTDEEQISNKLEAVSPPAWENLAAGECKKSHKPAASWSERAGEGEVIGQAIRTPDASPQQGHQLKELDLSWSERRFASPLREAVPGENENKWKRPAERKKKIKRKKETARSIQEEKFMKEKQDSESVTSNRSGDDELTECKEDQRAVMKETSEEDRTGKSVIKHHDDAVRQSVQSTQGHDEFLCNSIESRVCSTDSRVSGGFEPSLDMDEMDASYETMDYEARVNEIDNSRTSRIDADVAETCKTRNYSKSSILDMKTEKRTESMKHSDVKPGDYFGPTCSDNHQSVAQGFKTSVSHACGSGKEKLNEEMKGKTYLLTDEDEDSKNCSTYTSSISVDRYQTLLDVLSEFLADFFTNVREGLTNEQGVPVLVETVTFLDSHCSSTYIRALAKCLSPHGNISEPLNRLLHIATHLKAFHLHKILLESVPATEQNPHDL